MFLTLVLFVSLVFAGTPVKQTFPEKAEGKFDPAAYTKSMQEKFDWLMAEVVPLSERSIISIKVTQAELDDVESYKCETCGKDSESLRKKVRIGLTKPIDFNVPFEPVSTADGGYVCTVAAESQNATALRIHFSDFDLAPNAAVYIYNATGEAFGPYIGRGPNDTGDFWSHTVSGPMAFVQLRHFGPATEGSMNSGNFKISEVGHLGSKFLLPFLQKEIQNRDEISTTKELCNENESCVEDASCYSGGAISDAKYAVAHMQWISGAYIYYCTGGLLADTDSSSQIPYFLTANHCLSKSRDAAGLECYWQYWTSNCGGACYDPVGAVPRTLGATILSTNRTADYTFMQLDENPPAGSVFMGWTSAPVAFSNGTELFRISHPGGSPQAYSKHSIDTSAGTCTGWPRGDWIYSKDTIGATEGGSSGSPVYNLSGQVVGQLSGGCGTNVNDVCDTVSNATVDGAFAAYFSAVEEWLDPNTTPPVGDDMHVDSIVLSKTVKSVFTTAIAEVTILDSNGAPVANATVAGTFTGDIAGSGSALTDANGVAVISVKKKVSASSFSFCVDNVTHASFTYDSAANVETCDNF